MMSKKSTSSNIDKNIDYNKSEELTSGSHLDLYIEDSRRPKNELKQHGIQLISNNDIGQAIQNTTVIGTDDVTGTIGTSFYEEERV